MGDILWVSKHLMFICNADVNATFFFLTKYISLYFFFTVMSDKIKMVDYMLSLISYIIKL